MGGDEETGSAPFQMRDMHLQRIQAEADDASSNKTNKIHSQTRWEMDVMHELPESVLESLQIILSDAELAYEKTLIEGGYYMLSAALNELEKNGPAEAQVGNPYLHKYLEWIRHSVASVGPRRARPRSRLLRSHHCLAGAARHQEPGQHAGECEEAAPPWRQAGHA